MSGWIRGTHPYHFRSGKWAALLAEIDHASGRRCYLVRFDDGQSDFWPVNDASAGYEFSRSVPIGQEASDG